MQPAIIRTLIGYEDHPFEAIPPACFKHLLQAAKGKAHNGILTCFECYLEVTGQTINKMAFENGEFSSVCFEFIGALNSNRLLDCSVLYKYTLTRDWLRVIANLIKQFPKIKMPPVTARTSGPDTFVEKWVQSFELGDLISEKVWLWKGWTSINRSGVHTRMPLYFIYIRLGQKFTQKLFENLDAWYRARNSTRVPCLRALAHFIGQYTEDIKPSDFRDREFVSNFWSEFRNFFVRSSHREGHGIKLSTITKKWGQFINLLQDHLHPSGLFVEPWGELPALPVRPVAGSKTKIKRTPQGYEVKTKTLTHIPVHVSDEEAYNLLFKKIREEFDIVAQMSNRMCETIWRRYEYRVTAASTGTARAVQVIGANSGHNRWLTDRNNPMHLDNACATFAKHGYASGLDIRISVLYPRPLTLTAIELALPIADSLFPHCLLLVMEHPQITTTFLEELELYDENGRQSGFTETDAGARLVGHKCRRGPTLAQQSINLSVKAANIVNQIIAITEPVRTYLRKRGNDSWRFLLLSCGKAFGAPCRWRNISAGKWVPGRRERLVSALGEVSTLTELERHDLINRLTLSSIRASAGVLIYLKTKSVERMAEALGHADYDPDLLSHYLPRTISDFFQERWIRIFQTGIIVEALKDSPALLMTADFCTLTELHEFLRHHALKIPGDTSSSSIDPYPSKGPEQQRRSVIFGISVPILVALLSLELGVQKHRDRANAKAIYWARISSSLVTHIEENRRERPDLAAHLRLARQQAKPYSEAFLCGV